MKQMGDREHHILQQTGALEYKGDLLLCLERNLFIIWNKLRR
jgi:hypothetical protein